MTTKQLQTIEKELVPVATKAVSFSIKSDEDMKQAVELLSKLNRLNDKIEAEKDKVLKPLNEARTAEIKRWKPTLLKNETAIEAIRLEMSRYQTELINSRKDGEQRIADAVASGKIKKIETAVRKIEALPEVSSNIATDQGDVKFRTVRKFRIIDITKIPIFYLCVDEDKIKEAMKAGSEVTGVEFYEEQVPVNYR